LTGVLNSEMAEASDTLNCDQLTGARARVAQRVEDGDAGAEERGGFGGGEIVGDCRYRLGGRDHVLGVAAVVSDARNLSVFAEREVAAAAGFAGKIMASMPADSYALAGLPLRDAFADRVDAAGDFVTGDARLPDSGPMTFFHERVAMADAAGFDLDADLPASGFVDVAFDQFKVSTGLAYLDGFHAGHGFSSGIRRWNSRRTEDHPSKDD